MASKINILVLNHLRDKHIAALSGISPDINVICTDLEQAKEYISQTNILVTWGWMEIRPLYNLAPNLKWVHALSAGVENLLFPELQSANIILTNSKGIHGIPVSEHVFALMLAFTRGLNLLIRQQSNRQWQRVLTDEIYEKTIAIVGLGSIGREIAKKAKGMGMRVVATKLHATEEIFIDKLYTPEQLTEMLAVADFVVVALPLVEETKEMFRLEHFDAMKPSAYFINIARGGVVNETDLLTALQKGMIKGAGIDVFEHEPLPASSPLWNMENVIITPHLAALSPHYLDRAIQLFADNLARFYQEQEMFNIIDKQKGY